MKPATPLPWVRDFGPSPVIFKDGGNTLSPLAQTKGFDEKIKSADAAYIVHACNKYPQLVQALETAVARLESIRAAYPGAGDAAELAAARKLLIELGEV